MRRTAVAVSIAAALVAALAGCAPQQAEMMAVQQARDAAHAHYLKQKPAGYRDVGDGVAYRWLAQPCSGGTAQCLVLGLFAYSHCASVYFEGDLLDRRGRDLADVDKDSNGLTGIVNGTLPAMAPATTTTTEVTWQSAAGRSIRLTSLVCN